MHRRNSSFRGRERRGAIGAPTTTTTTTSNQSTTERQRILDIGQRGKIRFDLLAPDHPSTFRVC